METKKLVFALIALAFLFSCNDDDDGPKDSETNYRISEFIEYDEGLERYKSTFSYIGEELNSVIEYRKDNGTWIEYRKYEIGYNSNTVTITNFEKSMGWELDGKREYVFIDDLMTQETYYSNREGTLTPSYRYDYLYSGTRFTGYEEYDSYNGGSFELEYKGECVYSNDLITLLEFNEYELDASDWIQYSKETFAYANNKLSEVIDYSYYRTSEPSESDKDVYNYTGDLLSSIDDYDWSDDTETWSFDGTVSFTYNIDGYLIEANSSGDKEVFTYEEGKGNAKQLMATPELLLYQEPIFEKTNNTKARKSKKFIPYYKGLLTH